MLSGIIPAMNNPLKIGLLKKIWNTIIHWEQWPFNVIYAPLGFVWIYYAVKAKAFWFFSPANPSLEFAGFEGESKLEMYAQLPEKYYPATLFIQANEPVASLKNRLEESSISYPFIVKPAIGMQGMLFRKIENTQQLLKYHEFVQVDYIIQQLVNYPMEFSVFHIRYPGTEKGMVTGFILKNYLSVKGDGKSTLLELIKACPRASGRETEMRGKHAAYLDKIIPLNEIFYLSMAGNHNRGAQFINLADQIDQRLCNVFDKISLEAGQFYFGRYDLKSTSIEDLKAGKNFLILEFNGAGAEPNHIYDCGMSYKKALNIIVHHWHHMYKIGKINHKNGVPYWGYLKGYRYLKKSRSFFKSLYQADLQFEDNV